MKNDPSVGFDFFSYVPYYVFYNLHVISDWFLNTFPQKILHFLQPVISKTIGMGNLKGRFLKMIIPEKPLKVLNTNGHIS